MLKGEEEQKKNRT